MSKIKDVIHDIKEEAEDIGEKAEQLNAQLDSAVDGGLQKAQQSKFTGVGFLLIILVAVVVAIWLLVG